MAGVLGKYEWMAGMAIDFGVPALGIAFGIPGGVSSFAAGALKKALGMSQSASADDVKSKIDSLDPETAKAAFQNASNATTAKYAYLTALVQARAEVDKTNISEVNQTIRDENARGTPWWHWRHQLGYIVLLYALQQIFLVFYCALGYMAADQLAMLFNSTTILTGGLLGLLGFVARDNTVLKQTAMTGEVPEGMVSSAVRAVTGRVKQK